MDTSSSSSSSAMNEVVCSMCALSMARSDLEGHICSEHLDYYPYGCGFCGHWLATEDLAHFHAQKRQHLPMKIKENPNMHKERRLREILQQSLLASGQSGMQSPQLSVWQRNESSPSSTMNPDSGIDSILASDVSSRSPNATPLSQSSTKDAALDSDALPMSRLGADTRNKRSHNFEQQTLSQSFLGSNSKKSRIDSSATDDPAPIPIGDHPNEVHCRLCQMWLRGLNKLEHVKNHIKCRPRAACMYCQFKGATQNSVRVHITWKHAGRSTKVGFGVKDLSDIGSSEEEMIEMCFGSAPMTNTMEELMTITGCKARTAKAQPMPRTTIGSTKGMGGSVYARSTESGVSALIRQDPLPSVGAERINAIAEVQKRVSTSASGRQYKACPERIMMEDSKDPSTFNLSQLLLASANSESTTAKRIRKRTWKLDDTDFDEKSNKMKAVDMQEKSILKLNAKETANETKIAAKGKKIPKSTNDHSRTSDRHILPDQSTAAGCSSSTELVNDKEQKIFSFENDLSFLSSIDTPVSMIFASDSSFEGARKRRSFDSDLKLDAIEYSLKNGVAATARRYNVDRKTVRQWRKKKEDLEREKDEGRATNKRLKGAGRKPLSHKLESHLFEWYLSQKQQGIKVTHKELQNRALTLFNLLKDTGEIEKNATFSASQGWLWNFFNRHLVCQQCGQECLDALASAHIYQNHINERDAVKCPYCPYGVPYAIAEVKRHITAKHPGQPVDVIDRRGDLQNLYLHWRSICFPEIGTGVRKQTGSPLASMVPSAPVSMVMTSPGPLTIDLADENEDEEDDDDRQPLAVGDGVGQRANSKQINQNSRNKQKCYECGTEVTELWLPRHVWKHMSEELNINCFKCRVSGCNYETYLKRSLDSHCSYHEKGKTTDHFGFIDKRNDFTDEYNSCLKRCFGDAASLLKLGQGSEDFQDDSPLLTDENGSQRHSFDDFPEISAEDIESVSAAISDLNIWCHLCEMPVLRDTVEDHVWQKHLDGQMPFACSQCSEKFLTQIDVELHWKVHHPDSGEMDINQDTEAMDRFEATMAECFPDMSDPGFIKIEPEGPDAEYERSAFD